MTVVGRTGQRSGRPTEECGGEGTANCHLEQELKEVRKAAAAVRKRLEDELAEERRKAVEVTAQFSTVATGRSNLYADGLYWEGGHLAMC
jgi:hypothetical protein